MSLIGSAWRSGAGATIRATEVALALPRIALALERLADSADDLRRVADVAEELRAALSRIERSDVDTAHATLAGLVEAVTQLNGVVASLNTTVSPLQGATERLGRLVDRLPPGRRRVFEAGPGSLS